MCRILKRTCRAILLLIRSFVLQNRRYRRRRGLVKVPNTQKRRRNYVYELEFETGLKIHKLKSLTVFYSPELSFP